jgi:RND family efflux transporter MFP subunit
MASALRASGLILVAGLLVACEEQSAPPAPPAVPVRVEVVSDHSKDSDSSIAYSASIEATTQVSLAFQTDGSVVSLMQVTDTNGNPRKVEPGDQVEEGAVLASIDTRQLNDQLTQARAQLAAAQADLTAAQNDWQRTQTLYDQQSATATEYDSARQQYESALANVNVASAQVDQAQTMLGYADLVSPMSGVVVQRYIEVGSLVSPQNTAFELADPASLQAVFGVPDTALAAISLGDRLSVTTLSLPDQVFAGTVLSIAPAADSATRLYSVELALDDPDNLLKIGMIAALSLQVGEDAAQYGTVPIDALVRPDGEASGYAVYVVDQSGEQAIVRQRLVTVGEVHGNRIGVTSGLEVGDTVVVMGTNTVRDGQAVRIVR